MSWPSTRDPVELLLCGHHYRVSRDALRSSAAAVYDLDGMPLPDQLRGEAPDRSSMLDPLR
jgi:hypothetical protein